MNSVESHRDSMVPQQRADLLGRAGLLEHFACDEQRSTCQAENARGSATKGSDNEMTVVTHRRCCRAAPQS